VSPLRFKKPLKRSTIKAKRRKVKNAHTAEVRAYVFERDNYRCRVCKKKPATSMHEIRPRSLGGKVSPENSIAVCGDGTSGCHGMLQRHIIGVTILSDGGAESSLSFDFPE